MSKETISKKTMTKRINEMHKKWHEEEVEDKKRMASEKEVLIKRIKELSKEELTHEKMIEAIESSFSFGFSVCQEVGGRIKIGELQEASHMHSVNKMTDVFKLKPSK